MLPETGLAVLQSLKRQEAIMERIALALEALADKHGADFYRWNGQPPSADPR